MGNESETQLTAYCSEAACFGNLFTGQIHLFYICTFLRDYSFHENTLTGSVNPVSPFTICDVTNNSAERYMGLSHFRTFGIFSVIKLPLL